MDDRTDEDRTLEALGRAVVPREAPPACPGARPPDAALLDGDRLLPLDRPVHEDRGPVLAVGSNASPAQPRHKPAEFGVTSRVPMVKARVTGVDVGVSAHVSLMGYVRARACRSGAAPSAGRGCLRPTSGPRSPKAGCNRTSSRASTGTASYNDGAAGAPRRHTGDRRVLIGELLVALPRLGELFGDTPEAFCARARADRGLCDRGTRLFAGEGL